MKIEWRKLVPRGGASNRASAMDVAQTLQADDSLRKFLEAAGAAGETILVCVNDPHRSTQTRPVLDGLASVVHNMRSAPEFQILVATGTHHISDQERTEFEDATFSGCPLVSRKIEWHDAMADTLVEVGGVCVNQLLQRHTYVIPVGSVEPHYFAGVTGPHKTIAVGCRSRNDIESNHKGALDPASDLFRLKGNPVYHGLAATIKTLVAGGKKLYAIGQVFHGDDIVALELGDPLDVTSRLLPVTREVYGHEVDAPVDIMHLRVPSPMGRSLYQADKALKNNHLAVRNGGFLLLEADLEDGIGASAFFEFFRRTASYTDACREVERSGYTLGDHKAVKLHYLTDPACRDVTVVIVTRSHLADDVAGTAIQIASSVDEGIERFKAKCEQHATGQGLLIDDAGTVCTTARVPATF